MMSDTSCDPMSERLTRLERAYRRWQVIGGIGVLLFVALGLMGVAGQIDIQEMDEVRARAFVLVDRDGKPRMDLRVARNDSTHLVLLDREGLPRMSLNILTQGGTDIVLRDPMGLPRAALSVLPDGRPGLSLYDAAGTTRIAVGISTDEQARVVLYNKGGPIRWFTP
jgi:hypothetical protein